MFVIPVIKWLLESGDSEREHQREMTSELDYLYKYANIEWPSELKNICGGHKMSDDNFIGYFETRCLLCGDSILTDGQTVSEETFICGDCKKAVYESRKKRKHFIAFDFCKSRNNYAQFL